jgi:DNA (cytosine-5)-methyltransferase 1
VTSGELFAGVGGLGMAVDEVFGSSPAWFAEIDPAPSKVLAHRYPDVPNLGDVTQVDWASLDHVDILSGGFPCQDVSLAGRRRGMKEGTRSGLWSEFARAIDTIRPDWVVIENVRGLLSAGAAGDVEPCPWCLGDDGEQHALRALGAVLGDLAELGFDAEWSGVRAADVGAPHGRFRVFILAWPAAHTGHSTRNRERARTLPREGSPVAGVELLPTPSAGNFNDGEDPAQWMDRRERVKAEIGNGNGMGMPLSIAVQLLPTPQVADATGGHASRSGARSDELLLPGVAVSLLPTPRTTDMNGPGLHGDGGMDLRTAATLLPTPRATRGGSNTEIAYGLGGERTDEARTQGQVVPGTDWGTYAAAVERWARVIGREAPSPIRHDGKGGKARLNPELPEWMMGWPHGWVTDPAIGLTRAEQLKACGNGVVPQQAAHAIRHLLTRPGVPTVRQVVTPWS